MSEYDIRWAEEKDIESIMDMLHRLKVLNSEFDRHFSVRDDFSSEVKKYLKECINNREDFLILIAEIEDKIVSLLKIDIRHRIYYEPKLEARITEFYIMPEYRRRSLGTMLINEAIRSLKQRGIKILTTEFPTLNLIASSFFKDKGFRDMISILVKDLEE